MKKLCIIGGGPGGYVSAIRAAQLGFDVTLIEKEHLGGTCTNKGCIPTKTYAHASGIIHEMEKSEKYGIFSKIEKFDFSKTFEKKNEIVGKLRKGIEILLKGNKINYINDFAQLVDKNTVKLKNKKEVLTFDFIMLATGSIPAIPPIENIEKGINEKVVVTSEELLDMNYLPSSIVIIGGGVIGLEFASIFNYFGIEVTVLELLPEVLPTIDLEVAKRLKVYLKKRGVKINTGFKVNSFDYIEPEKNYNPIPVVREVNHGEVLPIEVIVKGEDSKGKNQEIKAELVLIATGRKPNFDKNELDKIGIKYDKAGIIVDEYFKTSIDNIYAVGDVIGKIMLAHVAEEQGKIAVENIFAEINGKKDDKKTFNYMSVPSAVFTIPEIASSGLTENQCKEQNINYGVSKFLFNANGKALAMDSTDGFVKIIYEKETKKIIGAHIIGPHASDLITELSIAIHHEKKAEFIYEVTHTHPTLPEAVLEAALSVDGIAIHKLN